MLKIEAMKLFKKIFGKANRTRSNWRGMLASLKSEGEITKKQAYKWYFHGAQPTTYFNGYNWVQSK